MQASTGPGNLPSAEPSIFKFISLIAAFQAVLSQGDHAASLDSLARSRISILTGDGK
jgi:hypothetical protein